MTDWFLLYGGRTCDGRGTGQYVGRTTSKKKAVKHAIMCFTDPYSVGFVVRVTDTEFSHFTRKDVFGDSR